MCETLLIGGWLIIAKLRAFLPPLPSRCSRVEKTPVSAVLSTGNDTRQHIKMGHTVRAASRLRLENSQFSLPSRSSNHPSRNFLTFLRSLGMVDLPLTRPRTSSL
ncbi:hypothetical protein CONLIGDRAFT_82509 [Coniochaeta ligniaria NRRL 30616]|uniref:Secreted protein n=1 Tax=Coniochaeta ligniaria NRRL 30616 TaxID=1408157 RepID=A0A1J7ICX6_9PEZI|nr:hypothetical protein CONLIGDRAFT_82509 [Coniochaeta ligniaria NRRL 30616]